jgi:hypothetical protein
MSKKRVGDVAQLVRALPCHGRGRGFEPRRPRHESKEFRFMRPPEKAEVAGLLWVAEAKVGSPNHDLCVSSRTLLTQIWNHHPNNLALRGALVRSHCLRVDLQRDPAVRVP